MAAVGRRLARRCEQGRPRANIRGGKRRGRRWDPFPSLTKDRGAAERASHGGRWRRAELLGAAMLEGRGGVLEVVDRLWSSEAR